MAPEKKKKITVLIVDDHAIVRSAISDMLSKSGDYVIHAAESGYDAIAYADEYDFDLVLMDIAMPEMNGFQTTRELIVKHPGMKILVLTGSYDKEDVFKMLEAGAAGYILKDAGEKELQMAVTKVLGDEYYFGSKPLEAIMNDFKKIVLPQKNSDKTELSLLTPREIEIIRYIAKGMVNKEIASKLFLSKRTVDKHRTNILAKLNVNNSAELIAYSVKYGLVE